MLKLNLSADVLSKIGLAANPENAAAIESVINSLVSKNDNLTTQLANSNNAKKDAEDKLSGYLSAESQKEIDAILDKALNTDKKITAEMKVQLANDYAGRPADLKKLVDSMPKFQSVAASSAEPNSRLATLVAMSWDELDQKGLNEELKALNEDAFKAKYKEKFGSEYGK